MHEDEAHDPHRAQEEVAFCISNFYWKGCTRKANNPIWPGSLFRAHVMPALKDAGITAPVGWHTLRHTFGTLMKANGVGRT
jgi:hypothetical protein